jgi:hypothetical protein
LGVVKKPKLNRKVEVVAKKASRKLEAPKLKLILDLARFMLELREKALRVMAVP